MQSNVEHWGSRHVPRPNGRETGCDPGHTAQGGDSRETASAGPLRMELDTDLEMGKVVGVEMTWGKGGWFFRAFFFRAEFVPTIVTHSGGI